MRNQQKYVRHSKVGFILFDDMTQIYHKHMAEFVVKARGGHVISAGFASFSVDRFICHGKSESLGIGGAVDDTESLNRQMGII